MAVCFSCSTELATDIAPGRGAECHKCGADLKVCLNCRFYESGAYNDCVEPNAERVVEKERANYCEYFQFSKQNRTESSAKKDPLDELKRLFDD